MRSVMTWTDNGVLWRAGGRSTSVHRVFLCDCDMLTYVLLRPPTYLHIQRANNTVHSEIKSMCMTVFGCVYLCIQGTEVLDDLLSLS